MVNYGASFGKKNPFVQLLAALVTGIILQFYLPRDTNFWWVLLLADLAALLALFFISFFNRYRFSFIHGILTSVIFIAIGALLCWQQNHKNDPQWLGHFYKPGDGLIVCLEEPPLEKTKSIKVNTRANYILRENQLIPINGKIILYFSKDVLTPSGLPANLQYGTWLLFAKPLQEIRNSGNPGAFDYKRYAAFQGIAHQVFLKPGEFDANGSPRKSRLKNFLFESREKILSILRTNIPGEKERGLAEALLIGYKYDLDQALVQSYTNTGVVHIIAISGLHLGLIYWMLALLLRPLKKKKRWSWLRPIIIISSLWVFSLLAGAQPSILRSALMFSCIVLGESLSKKTSIYNTMAVSAFVLLCINPYWLWDVGFQLSYAAVLSIIIFMQPVYNMFYIKNRVLDFIWKLNAVTVAAQILTVPVSIYHFHQFPNYFILTNFLAVPLSSVILLTEIFLCIISFIPIISSLTGQLISWLIGLMNQYIENVATLPFALWDGLQITLLQALLLLCFLSGTSYWLMERLTKGLVVGLSSLLCFFILRSASFIRANNQEKLIVYNIPQKKAIDIISSRKHLFVGDSALLHNDFLKNFHLKPSRVLHRVTATDRISQFTSKENWGNFRGKHILMLDNTAFFRIQREKPVVDLLIISNNPKIYFNNLSTALDIKQVVFDGSVPAWKSKYWKKDCDSLGIPWHDVTVKGAFVMSLR